MLHPNNMKPGNIFLNWQCFGLEELAAACTQASKGKRRSKQEDGTSLAASARDATRSFLAALKRISSSTCWDGINFTCKIEKNPTLSFIFLSVGLGNAEG